jgi:hypothetical protein
VHENESVYIPIGAAHRLENPGKILPELIEVQTGSYLGKDDITRIEDDTDAPEARPEEDCVAPPISRRHARELLAKALWQW